MKFKVHNIDTLFGDAAEEYFDTLEEARRAREDLMETMFDLWIEEAHNRAAEELTDQIRCAIQIDEEEGE